ncbi:hypothetical protein DLREEDagrD3_17790 [Denitratisoma sp. agr-D3]
MERAQALALLGLAPDCCRDQLEPAYRDRLARLRQRLGQEGAEALRQRLQDLRSAFLVLQEEVRGESLKLSATFATTEHQDDRYRGKGEIAVHPAQGILVVHGQRYRRLRPGREFFPLASVCNARMKGKTVYFTVPLSSRRHWHAVLNCASPAMARALWLALPEHIDSSLETWQPAPVLFPLGQWLRPSTINPAVSLALAGLGMMMYRVLGSVAG